MKDLKKVQKTLDRVFGYLNNQDLGEHGKSLLTEVGDAHRIVENLAITDVGITLPSDTDLNNYKIDLKTPLDYFYYYHRPNMEDEQPAFRESLQKALNYVKGN